MTCRICGKSLTGEGAFLGIGPVCRKHRAEAMQLRLEESQATVSERKEWKDAVNFEIVDFKPIDEDMHTKTGKSIHEGGTHIEIIDFDSLRTKD